MFLVGSRGFWKACETNNVNQKHVYSYIFKINIIMNTAYLWKYLNTHSLGEDKGTDSKWKLLLYICVWRKKIISWNTCPQNRVNHINDIWIRHLYLVTDSLFCSIKRVLTFSLKFRFGFIILVWAIILSLKFEDNILKFSHLLWCYWEMAFHFVLAYESCFSFLSGWLLNFFPEQILQ